jgi:hypothetical protein
MKTRSIFKSSYRSIFLFLLFFMNLANAEGGCPPGMYPPNPANTNVCYPFPDSQQSQQQQKQAYWQSRYGAIAIGSHPVNGTVAGLAKNMASKQSAEKLALADCKAQGGGQTCKLKLSYYNQCAAIVWGDSFGVVQGAETVDVASDIAMQECASKTKNCRVLYTDCSLPVLIK